MSRDIIKPCPCCGEQIPVHVHNVDRPFGSLRMVICDQFRAGCGTQSGLWNTKREAIRAWNRRAASNTGGKP